MVGGGLLEVSRVWQPTSGHPGESASVAGTLLRNRGRVQLRCARPVSGTPLYLGPASGQSAPVRVQADPPAVPSRPSGRPRAPPPPCACRPCLVPDSPAHSGQAALGHKGHRRHVSSTSQGLHGSHLFVSPGPPFPLLAAVRPNSRDTTTHHRRHIWTRLADWAPPAGSEGFFLSVSRSPSSSHPRIIDTRRSLPRA